MKNAKHKLKRVLCLILSLVMVIPVAFFKDDIFLAANASGITSKSDNDEKVAFKAYDYYNQFVKGTKYDYEYQGDEFQKINEYFKVYDEEKEKYVNMTNLNNMKPGETVYALIGSNAYVNAQGDQNPIGFFLKYRGTGNNEQSYTTLSFMNNGTDIRHFIWRITKLESGFAITSSHKDTDPADTWILRSTEGKACVWTTNGLLNSSGEVNKNFNSGRQVWYLNPVGDGNKVETLYHIKDDQGKYLRSKITRKNRLETAEENRGDAVNIGSLYQDILPKRYSYPPSDAPSLNGKWDIGSANDKWSQWIILPLLQSFVPTTYGYTGGDIKSTISSLSKADAHTSNVRKARTADGLLLFKDTKTRNDYGKYEYNKIYDNGEEIYYTDYQEILATETEEPRVYIGTYSGWDQPKGPYHVYEGSEGGKKFVYVDRNGDGDYDADEHEKLFMMYESNYGQGFLNFDTVYGNNITFVENDKISTIADEKKYFLHSINGRITPPELVPSEKNKQYMSLHCTGGAERYMLWDISSMYDTSKRLAANKYFEYSDQSIYGGSKAYVSWIGQAYVENKNYLVGNQSFFIFYSMNADGGYYLAPLDFEYGSSERNNFRIIEIASYNTPEMLQLWDYNHGVQGRFWIDSNDSTSKIKTKVVDLLVDFDEYGKVVSVDEAYSYYKTSTDEKYRPLLNLNSAFYDIESARFENDPYYIGQYEKIGYCYAFDSAKTVTREAVVGEKNKNGQIEYVAVCYRFFYKFLTGGENIIVKNVDAINTAMGYYTLEQLEKGIPNQTYRKSADVYAPFKLTIGLHLTGFNYCWYVNDIPEYKDAKKIGTIKLDDSSDVQTLPFNQTVTFDDHNPKDDHNPTTENKSDGKSIVIDATISSRNASDDRYTELKINNPTKAQNDLYFFCVAFVHSKVSNVFWQEIFTDSVPIGGGYGKTDFLRLNVADNIVYHNVTTENGEIETEFYKEDWIVYGTNKRVEGFNSNGYIKYTDNMPVSDSDYKLINYPTGANKWVLFEDTIKNPNNNNRTLQNYKDVYKSKYGAPTIDSGTSHGYWGFSAGNYFNLDGDRESIFHDTTINLYAKRSGSVSLDLENVEVELFIDQFGTIFVADQYKPADQYNPAAVTVIKPLTDNNDNIKFSKEKIYVVAASEKEISSKLNIDQINYSINAGDKVKLVGSDFDYTKLSSTAAAKEWCEYAGNASNLKYNLAIDIDYVNFIETVATKNGDGGINKAVTVQFFYGSGDGSGAGNDWFNFGSSTSPCTKITLIPFKYNPLT